MILRSTRQPWHRHAIALLAAAGFTSSLGACGGSSQPEATQPPDPNTHGGPSEPPKTDPEPPNTIPNTPPPPT